MNPTCREIEGLLSPYLDRELDPLVARRVEEHLVSCVACSDALVAMREAGRVLAAAVPLRSEAEWEALALRVEMAIDREEARVFQEAASQEVVVAAALPDFAVASPRAATMKRETTGRRTRGFGWWAYGSGAIAAAMLVLLLWPWFIEHVEEGPPAPGAKAPQVLGGRDESIGRDERATSPVPEQEQLTVREPASSEMREPAVTAPGEASSPIERKLDFSAKGAPAPATKTEVDALRSAEGVLRNEASPPVAPSPAAPSPVKRQDFSAAKEKDARSGVPSETPPSANEPEHLEQSADGGSAQSAPEGKVAPAEQEGAKKKLRAPAPQPMSKNEVSQVWGETKSFRTMTKSMSEPSASDTPPPPTVQHFSETEWAEMSELQTQEALKAGTEKSLAEAAHVLESFLQEYPRSAFRPQVGANLLRTTSALVQLNPNLWCERATVALEGWKLEKPPPVINVDAEIATIEGRCLK